MVSSRVWERHGKERGVKTVQNRVVLAFRPRLVRKWHVRDNELLKNVTTLYFFFVDNRLPSNIVFSSLEYMHLHYALFFL